MSVQEVGTALARPVPGGCVLSDVVFRIQRSARGKTKVVHADRLKLYEGPALVSWVYRAPEVVEEKGPELHKVGEGDPSVAREKVEGTRESTDERAVVNEGVATTEGPIKDVRGDQDVVEGEGTVKSREVDGERVGHEMETDGEEQKAREKSVGVEDKPAAGDQDFGIVGKHNMTGGSRDSEGGSGERGRGRPRRSPRRNRQRPARYR